MKLTFQGRRALLLGGGCDLGLALIPLLDAEGLEVFATAASAPGRARLAALLPPERIYTVHLGEAASVSALAENPPLVDYLVDLAHLREDDALLLSLDPAKAHATWMAMGAHRHQLICALGRGMLARRFGRMLYVSSTAAAVPAPGQGLYSALKRAAEGIYHALGVELASRGVSTVSLRLGLTQAGRGAAFLEHHPHLPWVSPEDAASCMVFLLSDQGLCIRLTSITVDAGLLARKYSS